MIIGINTVSSQSGRAYAADLIKRGYTIYGYARESEHGTSVIDAINKAGGLYLDRPYNSNGEEKEFLKLENSSVGHDISKLVNISDYILLAQPSHYFIQSVIEMKKKGLLQRRIPIILSPSRSFSTPYIWRELGKGYPVVSFSTCPYSCKAPRLDTSFIKRRKRVWIASLEGEFTLEQIAELGQLFPQAVFNKKPITTSIGNIGAIFHPATYLLNYEQIKKSEREGYDFSFYMEGIASRPEVAEILEQLDQMRLEIAVRLGYEAYGYKINPLEDKWTEIMDEIHDRECVANGLGEIRMIRRDGMKRIKYSIPSCQHWLDYTYGVDRIPNEKLYETIRRTPTYQKNSKPQTRYIEEDIATGLIPLTMFAKRLQIDTTVADDVLMLSKKIYPNRNHINDYTLKEFSSDYLIDYLNGEFFSVID